MNSTFVVINLNSLNINELPDSVKMIVKCIPEDCTDLIVFVPEVGKDEVKLLGCFFNVIGCTDNMRTHFVLGQEDMLNMSINDMDFVASADIGVYTKGDTIRLDNGLVVRCDDMVKDSFTSEELDEMYLTLLEDKKNFQKTLNIFAWDYSDVDKRISFFKDNVYFVEPISNFKLFKVFDYDGHNRIISYTMDGDNDKGDYSEHMINIKPSDKPKGFSKSYSKK